MKPDLKQKLYFSLCILLIVALTSVGYFLTQSYQNQYLKLHTEPPVADFTILKISIILLAIILTIIVYYSIFRLSKAYFQSFDHLNQAIDKMAADDFSYRINYKKKDEFTDTFTKLNRTIEKVGYLKEDYKKAEKRVVSLLKAVNESILVVDSRMNVTSFNDATSKLFRADRTDFSDLFVAILQSNRELHDQLSMVIKTGRRIREKEMTVFLVDDTPLQVQLSMHALKEEDAIQGAVITFKDLHSINELENNLLRSMKYGVITNLASSISHEIKNPLSAMALHAEVLEGRLKKMDFVQKDQVLKSVEMLQGESKRLTRIIEQFLTLARPAKLGLNLININKIIQEVLELVQQQAQENRISIECNLDSPIGVLYGDEDQIKQVILNIILNAFVAMPDGGKLVVRTHHLQDSVKIEVIDSGMGIPKKIRDKIFDLYFTTKRDGGGVGLSVCQNIIKAHDGRIDFESEKGKGTTFFIHLPVKDPTTIRSTRIKPTHKAD